MQSFNFHNRVKIIFGEGKIKELSNELKPYKNILFVYGGGSIKKNGIHAEIVAELNKAGVKFHELSGIDANPRLSSANEGIKICKEQNIDFILAVGGGSVIDCSKAIAAGAFYNGDVWDFYKKTKTIEKAIPLGVVLTIAATGSEMNGYSVLKHDDLPQKMALNSAHVYPLFSIIDPKYTTTLSEKQTATGAMDILSHLIEQYFTGVSFETTDALTESLMRTIIKTAPIAMAQPNSIEARASILWTASLALNSLTTTGKGSADWVSHTIESKLSGRYDNAHGEGLAILIPAWFKYVLNDKNAHVFARYGQEVFGVKSGTTMEMAQESIKATENFIANTLKLPTKLRDIGAKEQDLEEIAVLSMEGREVDGTFFPMKKEDMLAVLKLCY